uniref:(California timema) hypothetical protein n=1 Tax=Timema californicum TaxID=61474 RepID=A0A7R9JH65_TIMCA|nr:unnamed protein product [Timema californicum]
MYMKFPLWLNAETVNMSDKEIDKFISLCTHNFPKATLSIGMLHKGQKIGSEIGYNAKLVTQMKDTLTRNNVMVDISGKCCAVRVCVRKSTVRVTIVMEGHCLLKICCKHDAAELARC